MPKNVDEDLGNLIVAKGFKRSGPKSNKLPNLVTLLVPVLVPRDVHSLLMAERNFNVWDAILRSSVRSFWSNSFFFAFRLGVCLILKILPT